MIKPLLLTLMALLMAGCASGGPYKVTTTKGVYNCVSVDDIESDGRPACITQCGLRVDLFLLPGEITKVEKVTTDDQ